MNTLITFKNLLQQLKGQKQVLDKELTSAKADLQAGRRRRKNVEAAQVVLQEAGKATQSQLEYHINDVVSLALEAVFDDPYELKLEFVEKRGKTEAEIKFVRDGEAVDPLSSSGGGAVDVASFALRIALWSLKTPRSRNTIILDEPFRFLSRELQPRAGLMLQELSKKLGLQFIIVTHEIDLTDSADKVFTVKKSRSGVSKVEEA